MIELHYMVATTTVPSMTMMMTGTTMMMITMITRTTTMKVMSSMIMIMINYLYTPPLSARSTRSADRGLPHVPLPRTSAIQNRGFSVAGLLSWNSVLPVGRSLPRISSQMFLQQLKQRCSPAVSLGALLGIVPV